MLSYQYAHLSPHFRIHSLTCPLTHATTGVVKIASGNCHTLLLKHDGSAWAAGDNSGGQLGIGWGTRFSKTFKQAMQSRVMAVAAGTSHSIIVKDDNTVWTTGDNAYGQLGDRSTRNRASFVYAVTVPNIVQVAAGHHNTFLLADSRLWVTGWNKYGQLGAGSNSDRKKFAQLGFGHVIAVAAGDIHSLILRKYGGVWGAGSSSHGQLGDSRPDRNKFTHIKGPWEGRGASVAAGGYHSLVLTEDSSVWASGRNTNGQLGNGTTVDSYGFVQVFESEAKAIAAGRSHSVILKEDGSVWSAGFNLYGQLGDGSRIEKHVFVRVRSMFSGASFIVAGAHHTMVLKNDYSVWLTGSNKFGQFGDDSKAVGYQGFIQVIGSGNGFGFHDGNHRFGHFAIDSFGYLSAPNANVDERDLAIDSGHDLAIDSGHDIAPPTTETGSDRAAPTEQLARPTALVPNSNVCPKCGVAKKSGKLSCCVRGGSWFKTCGDASTFDHTWSEGMQACNSK